MKRPRSRDLPGTEKNASLPEPALAQEKGADGPAAWSIVSISANV